MTVLVAAASKYGATQEIAETIGRVLTERGVETEIKRIDDVGDVGGYDAVVLGSAVYVGKWLEPARRFVDEHPDELAARPTWLFSSGPLGSPPRPSEDKAVDFEPILERTQAREHRLFAGKVDKSRLSFAERASCSPSAPPRVTFATGTRSQRGPRTSRRNYAPDARRRRPSLRLTGQVCGFPPNRDQAPRGGSGLARRRHSR